MVRKLTSIWIGRVKVRRVQYCLSDRRLNIEEVRRVPSDNDGEGQSISKYHNANGHSGDFPRLLHPEGLESLWPYQVEEECSTENCSDGDTDKDVIGRDADKIVVEDGRASRSEGFFEISLLVNIVCDRSDQSLPSDNMSVIHTI